MKRNKFSLSHSKLLSCDMGELVPIGWFEVLPGDSIQHSTSALIRAAPMLAPVMHPVEVRIHHWYVPNRLLWDDFENFITGGPLGTDASVHPTITSAGAVSIGTLRDYLGIPTGFTNITYSALPIRAYNRIWNENYRDQDLETALAMPTASGNDTTSPQVLQRCSWEKDYFTSARPWEQKGPAITIPLGTTAPVIGLATNAGVGGFTNTAAGFQDSAGGNPPAGSDWSTLVDSATTGMRVQGNNTTGFPNIRADISSASAITITLLREALSLQRFEEARARFGSRYTEYLRYLGVRSSDARLQRPEYLGGGRQTIQFSEVLQTSTGGAGPGDMFGHGIAAMRSNRYRRFFEEHGIVMSLMSVRPKTIYMDGLYRKWNRTTKYDYWQKEIQHIGQQKVLNKEVYLGHASPNGTFAYQDRYDEYRREESMVHGDFRSTLNFWHFARDFSSEPALNASFVSCVPSEVPFSVPAEDVIYGMIKHSIQARRLVSKSGSSFTM